VSQASWRRKAISNVVSVQKNWKVVRCACVCAWDACDCKKFALLLHRIHAFSRWNSEGKMRGTRANVRVLAHLNHVAFLFAPNTVKITRWKKHVSVMPQADTDWKSQQDSRVTQVMRRRPNSHW
jgi:hypothetical protein